MSSPLRWFRRNALFFMVVFGIGAMIIFGLGSVVSMINPADLARSNRAEVNKVIATWNGGDITRADISRITERHFGTRNFLAKLQEFALSQKNDPESFRPTAIPISPITSGEFNEEMVDDRVVTRLLLAEKAKEEGLLVGDDMVVDYLRMVCGDVPVTINQMKEINRKINSDRLSFNTIKRHLKMELAAQQITALTNTSMPIIPNTSEAIQLYAKKNRVVECKVLPFKVEDYLDKVTEEPTNAELRKLFEEGRYRYEDVTGERPGFKQDKKVATQYFVANYETFLENEMNKLTDEMIQKEYERLVETGDDIVMEIVPVEKPDDQNGDNLVPLDDPLPGLDDDAPKPNDDEAPKPTGDDPAPAPASESSGGAENAEKNGEQTDQEDKGADQSSILNQGISFVSLVQEEQEKPEQSNEKAGEKAGEKPAEDGEPTASGDDSGKQEANDESADPAPAPAESDANSTNQDPKTDEPVAETPAKQDAAPKQNPIVGPALGTDDDSTPEKRVRPLTEVKDEVKRSMKAKDARQAVEDALRKAENEVRLYQMRLSRYESAPDESKGEEPEPMDFVALGKKYNLEFKEIKALPYKELKKEELGKINSFVFQNNQPRMVNIADSIFGAYYQIPEYEPRQVEDFQTRSTYLFWLSDKQDQVIRTFDEARQEVVDFWKRQKALEAARAAAQSVADQINKSGDLMSVSHPESIDTGEFTWFSRFGNAEYSRPAGVTFPGEEFMETAFGLEERKVGVAANEMLDTIYAIQLVKQDTKTLEELGNDYLENTFFTFKRIPQDISGLAGFYVQEINAEWIDEFTDSMGLKWVGR